MLRFASVLAVSLAAPAAAQPAVDPLVGHLVDPDGEPVAGARVEAWRAEGRGMGGLDVASRNAYRLIAARRTNKNGRFFLRLPRGLPVQLRVDHAPWARLVRDSTLAGSGLRLQLRRAATLAGDVVRTDGDGVQASMRVWAKSQPRTEVRRGKTDAAGAFRFERLPPGEFVVSVEPELAVAPRWLTVELRAGAVTKRRIGVLPGVALRGRVTDAKTGKPVPGAEIGEGWVLHRAVRSGADGAYAMAAWGSEGYRELHCRAAGFVKQVVRRRAQGEEPVTIDFALERGDTARGRVVDPSGKGLAGVYVAVVGMVHDGRSHYHDWIPLRTDDAGRFATTGLRPDLEHVVLVRRDGWATLVYGLKSGKGVRDAGVIAMRRPRTLRGQVVGDDDPEPLARVKVVLLGCNADRGGVDGGAGLAGLGGWRLLQRYVARRQVYTDPQGRFAFGDLPAGTYEVVVEDARSQKIGIEESIEVTADRDPDPVRVLATRD